MKTTFSRTIFAYIVILLTALLVVGISFQALVKNYLTTKAIEGLKNDSSTVARLAAAYYSDDQPSDRDFLVILSAASSISDANIVICDAVGKLLLCSDAPMGCEHQGLAITSQTYLDRILSQEHVISSGIIDGLYADARYDNFNLSSYLFPCNVLYDR